MKELQKIANKIDNYLKIFDYNNYTNSSGNEFLLFAKSLYSNNHVIIHYSIFNTPYKLNLNEAKTYLNWLKKENVGTHLDCFQELKYIESEITNLDKSMENQ